MLKEDLIVRKSFAIAHNNGCIWIENLDSLYDFSDVVESKFLDDMKIIKKPSSPSSIAINLNQTQITKDIGSLIVENLIDASFTGSIRKVSFVGIDRKSLKIMKKIFCNYNVKFEYNFFNDFVKAKDWLI